jgi:predicted ATP-grasp superfamily ATP-dependent carboligase
VKPRALITDSDNRSALAATRSLGAGGHEVFVMGEKAETIAAVSRFASRFLVCPSPQKDPEGFVAAVLGAVREHGITLLLPMTEVTTLLLTRARGQLPPSCVLPFAEEATLQKASDKTAVMALADSLGVPTPASVTLNTASDLDRVGALPYPVVVKPGRSRVRTPTGWLSTGVTYAADEGVLRTRLAELPPETYPVMLQERIQGPGEGFFALYAQGTMVASFAHRRLREKPPSGGVSVLRESADIPPDAMKFGTALLDALKWHGVAMVEFKRDAMSGRLYLMEINARFWGSLQLAIDSGVDFPLLLARIAAGEIPAAVRHKAGVRSRWLLGDLDVLIQVMTRPRSSLNLPANFPSRGKYLLEFLKFWGKDQKDEIWRAGDRKPGWFELRKWLSGR